MFNCPEEYCVQRPTGAYISYDSCADRRTGTLCGRCEDGYSESLFGPVCIPNDECGWHNWYIAVLIPCYGLGYLLFFMFERDFARFLRWITKKCKKVSSTDDRLNQSDLSDSGYFPTFMYFVQTSVLLKVDIVIEKDEVYKNLYRPQDLLPKWIIDGIKRLFSFDVMMFHSKSCLFPDVTPVMKTGIKLSFVLYLFVVLLLLYTISMCCCVCMLPSRRPRLGKMSMNARVLCTVVALFLYTYQSVAEEALLLLNCQSVDGDSVLFLDGTISCLQQWQFAVIALVGIFIVPFFIVLLFGPKLLATGKISVGVFFLACIFPLFLSVPLILIYIGLWKRNPDNEFRNELEEDEKHTCCGDSEEISDSVVDIVIGPYRSDILNGLCWEGAINFRRMILVILFTFFTDKLIKQMALAFTCFMILLVHLKVDPFKQRYSNLAESISLTILVMLSGMNMVKAAFYHSQAVPRGGSYLAMIIFEWIEAIFIGLLPICIIAIIVIALVVKSGRTLCCGFTPKQDDDDDDHHHLDRAIGIVGNSLTRENIRARYFDRAADYSPYLPRAHGSRSQRDPYGLDTFSDDHEGSHHLSDRLHPLWKEKDYQKNNLNHALWLRQERQAEKKKRRRQARESSSRDGYPIGLYVDGPPKEGSTSPRSRYSRSRSASPMDPYKSTYQNHGFYLAESRSSRYSRDASLSQDSRL